MSSRVSLNDVAQLAGVSKTTASVVLSRGKQFDRIGEECVRRVEASARELGYVPHHAMRSVRIGRAEAVGLVLEVHWGMVQRDSGVRVTTGYFDEIWSGMRAVCQLKGSMPVEILPPTGAHRAVKRAIRAIKSGQLDGIIVPAVVAHFDQQRILSEGAGLPIVLVDAIEPSPFPSIRFNTAAGVSLMVSHLRQLGHQKVLWLGQDSMNHGPQDRERAFITAAWDAGLQGVSCRYEDSKDRTDAVTELPRQALLEHLRANWTDRPFTAVACYNDANAVGALRALRDFGLRVPESVSVIGFDRSYADYAVPRLTTIDHKLFEMGRRAAEVLFKIVEGDEQQRLEYEDYVEIIEPELWIGETTAPAVTMA